MSENVSYDFLSLTFFLADVFSLARFYIIFIFSDFLSFFKRSLLRQKRTEEYYCNTYPFSRLPVLFFVSCKRIQLFTITMKSSPLQFTSTCLMLLLKFSRVVAVNTEGCTNVSPPVLGCDSDENVVVTFPNAAGQIQCGSALTLEQAGEEPTLSFVGASSTLFYTILLVDTSVSFVHPVLHYGASNVPGSDLTTGLMLAEASPFSEYRGPNPPVFFPSDSFNYEWIVAEQNLLVQDLPSVEKNTNFNYTAYLDDVGASTFSTLYFSSGFCVVDENPSASPTMDESSGVLASTYTTITGLISMILFL